MKTSNKRLQATGYRPRLSRNVGRSTRRRGRRAAAGRGPPPQARGRRPATRGTSAPVVAFPEDRSPYGICQIAGNVDEWCEDWYQWDVYHRYAAGDLRPPVSGEMRVVRGGISVGWQQLCFRCAHRRGNDPALVNILSTGIRCACDAPFSPGILPMAEQRGQPMTL